MKNKELLKTLTFAVGQVFSRILSLLFIFILSNKMKSIGLIYYSYAYIPYSIFSDLSAFGLIPGVSSLTARLHSENKVGKKYYLFKIGTLYSIFLGIAFFLLLNLFSHKILSISLSDISDSYDYSVIINNIRIASYSLFFIPLISFYRGYLQGHLKIVPTVLALVGENLFKIILLLVFVKEASIKSISDALYFNFYGYGFSLIILFFFVYMDYFKKTTRYNAVYSIIESSIPFGVVTLFFTFYTFIDSLTLSAIGINGDIYTAYMFEAIRIIFLPITIAQSLGGFLNPKINDLVKKDRMNDVKLIVEKSTRIVIYILIPLIFIIKLYAKSIYEAFYNDSDNYMVLYHLADLILYIGFYKVLIGILNALPKFTYIICATLISIIAKLFLNFVLGSRLNYLGAMYATIISIGICIVIAYYILYKAKIYIIYDNLKSFILALIIGFVSYVIALLFRAIFIYNNFSTIWDIILFSIVFLSVYSLFQVFVWFVKSTRSHSISYINTGSDENEC